MPSEDQVGSTDSSMCIPPVSLSYFSLMRARVALAARSCFRPCGLLCAFRHILFSSVEFTTVKPLAAARGFGLFEGSMQNAVRLDEIGFSMLSYPT